MKFHLAILSGSRVMAMFAMKSVCESMITLERYKIAQWNFTSQLNLSKCVSWARMKALALLICKISAHWYHESWADNSKTKRARVFILVYDTHLDQLSSPFEISLSYLVRFKSYGGVNTIGSRHKCWALCIQWNGVLERSLEWSIRAE